MHSSVLVLFCIVAIAFAQPPVPDIPNQFQAKVTITLPFIGTNPGVYYYDYPNTRVRYDLNSFFGTSTTIQRYDIATPTEYDIFAGAGCQTKPLNDTMNSLDLPPFSVFVAYENVNSVECAHWTADFFGINLDWWISNSTDDNGKVAYQLVKWTESFFGTEIDFGATIVGPVDYSYFDVSSYGCTPPVPPVTYTVSGYVKNAVNNQVISGATVVMNNQSVTTGTDGMYSFTSLGSDVYTIKASASGFYSSTTNVNVTQDIPAGTSVDFSLSPTLNPGSIRAVLSWGATPRDLDAHLNTPSGCQVWYRSRTCGTYASLDVDQTQGFGPETVSINLSGQTGTFTYYVVNYSGEQPLTVSNGRVQVFGSTGLLADFSVPTTGSTSYRYWTGFTVDQTGAVTVVNQLVASAPTL